MNDPAPALSPLRRFGILFALVVAGEAVFLLPFVFPRIFRPTLLDATGLSNSDLGSAFAVYGLLALLAYAAGGPLADRFPARRLLASALGATAAGGLVLAQFPALPWLRALYGYWGLTTILLFWSALIRATREWGGAQGQGRAFGLLDGGRGLFAALLASGAVALLAFFLPENLASATPAQRLAALRQVVWLFSGFTLLAALLVWLLVPERAVQTEAGPRLRLADLGQLLRLPAVWLQGLIIVCAYVGYKSIDDLSLFARDALGYDEVAAAQVSTLAFWMRPLAAAGAGLLGDRLLRPGRLLAPAFALILAGSLAIAGGLLQPGAGGLLAAVVVLSSAGVFAVRGLYFALFEEAGLPLALTGSAAGFVSLIGFTPDIFMGPMMGYFLDGAPGAEGHRRLFAALAAFAAAGMLASFLFARRTARN
jgi:nitrate/nitrite transporter NarK